MGSRRFASRQLRTLVALAALVAVGAAAVWLRPLGNRGQVAAEGMTVELHVPIEPQPLGTLIDIPLRVQNASRLAAFEARLHYDPARVEYLGVSVDTFLGRAADCAPDVHRCLVPLSLQAAPGVARLGAYTFGSGDAAQGDGVLAVLHLRTGIVTGTTTLRLDSILLTDDHSAVSEVLPITAPLIIGAPDAPATETATATASATATLTATATRTATVTPSATATTTSTLLPTATSTATALPTPSATPTGTPVALKEYDVYAPMVQR